MHSSLSHDSIVKIEEFGDDGQIKKPSGEMFTDIKYIIMDYIDGGVLYNICEDLGPLGEDAARFLF